MKNKKLLYLAMLAATTTAIAAPVILAPGSATKLIVFDELATANGKVKPYGEKPVVLDKFNPGGGLPTTEGCAAISHVSWVGAANKICTSSIGALAHGAQATLVASSPMQGSAQYQCVNGTLAQVSGSESCQDAPSERNCSSGAASWAGANGAVCTASHSQVNHLASASLRDNTGPTTGTATFSCNDGALSFFSGSCIGDPEPQDCSATTVTWGSGALTCSAPIGSLAHGAGELSVSDLVSDTVSPGIGSARYTCNDGSFQRVVGSDICRAGGGASPDPQPCAAATATWQQNGLTCSAERPTLASGASITLDSTNAHSGSATLTCNDGLITQANPVCQDNGSENTLKSLTLNQLRSCGITRGGAAKCWGRNDNGMVGAHDVSEYYPSQVVWNRVYLSPSQVMGLTSGVSQIDVSRWSACAIHNSGLKCWGLNNQGQIGDGTTNSASVPVQVVGLNSGVTKVKMNSGIVDNHACAIHNGGLKCWGANSYGQLGNGTTNNSSIPVQVTGLTSGVSAVEAFYDTTCAIHNDALKCWGRNNQGQLGNGTTNNSSIPVQVTGLTSGVTAIEFGYLSACAIHNGGVKCWGYNFTRSPASVAGLTSGVSVISSKNNEFYCAIHNGGVKCWGNDRYGYGVLGHGSSSSSSAPVQVTGLVSGVSEISSGNWSTCAVHNGAVKCWGLNSDGQLGNGTKTNSNSPSNVSGISSLASSVQQGTSHSCVVHDGSNKCWGINDIGQLGNGTTASSTTPVEMN